MAKYKMVLKDTKETIKDDNEYLQSQIDFCNKALKNPYGAEASDAKANYGDNWKKCVREDLAKFKKQLAECKKVNDSCTSVKDYWNDYDELEFERDGEEDDKYLVIEGRRDGYGISQVEDSTITVGELIDILSQYDSNTKVVIGNDPRGGSYYTYGQISENSIQPVTIVDSEEYDEEYEDEEEED